MVDAYSLVIETSTPCASIALWGPDGLIEQHGFTSDRNHNAMLFEPLQQTLATATGKTIQRVLVGSGPGSYSGTRVGIAAAQGVAISLGCPAVAVPSILAMPAANGRCLVIGDARRGSYWTATVAARQLASPPAVCSAADLDRKVAAALTAGAAVISVEEPSRWPTVLPAELADQIRREFPDASRLWQAWLAADHATRQQMAAQIPQPLYLKPPHITPAKPPRWRDAP